MQPAVYDFTLVQGTDQDVVALWKDADGNAYDLSTFTGRLQCKSFLGASEALIELTTENGGMELDSSGHIFLHFPATASSALGIVYTTLYYDLELISSSDKVYRPLKGTITLDFEATT